MPSGDTRKVCHVRCRARVQVFCEKELESPKGLSVYDTLTWMQDRQIRPMGTLATKLRMTLRSRYGHRTANTAANRVAPGPRPWDE